MGLGVSGILAPDGTFHDCEFGQHHSLIQELNIPRFKQDAYIPMSSRRLPPDIMEGFGWDSAVFIQWKKGITKAQADWILEHQDEFDQNQFRHFIRLLLKRLEKNEMPIVEEKDLWM